MEKLQPEIKRDSEKGHNITLNFVFARHGEKSGEGEESVLTEKGQKQAAELGQLIKVPKDGIKVYYSDKIRNKQTAEILMKELALPSAQAVKLEQLKRQGFKGVGIHKQEKLLGVGVLTEEMVKTQFGGSAKFVELDEKDIPQDITSPRELAAAIAKHIIRFIEVGTKLPSNVEGTLVNVTHLPTITAFLKNAIGQEIELNPINPQGKNFVEKIGGPINPTESIILKMHCENPKDCKLTVQLRGKEFFIDFEELKLLAKYQRVKKE